MRAVLLTICLALLVGGGGVYAWLYYGGFGGEKDVAIAFIDVYGDYADVAHTVDQLVHLPGTEGNVDRVELESLLEDMLTGDVGKERRDTLARLAYQNVDTLKKEIDAAQTAQAQVYERLQDLDNMARQFVGVRVRAAAADIVLTARTRTELTARITSILSEINTHTHAIVTQILEDEGELTDVHVAAMNAVTQRAEERHATLASLYDTLLRTSEELETAMKHFVSIAL